jgi:hypothetical protein
MTASNYDAQASTNYKEAFALFDKRGNQRVQLESLGDLLRACGQNPTLAEIRELEKSVVGNDCKIMSPSSSTPHPHPSPTSTSLPNIYIHTQKSRG